MVPLWRRVARNTLAGLQKSVWSSAPLDVDGAQKILRSYDPQAEVRRRFHSWCCQAFDVTFRGRHCVAKFAGLEFSWKYVLQREVARLRQLASAGIRVPEVVFADTRRLRRPFYVMPFLGESENDRWELARRELAWKAEADFIHDFPDIVARARLSITSLADSESVARREIERTRADLRAFGLPEENYHQLFAEYEAVIFSEPWTPGQWQAPVFLHDGTHFWPIDWSDIMMIPPSRRVMDYTLYQRINEPDTGRRHVDFLLRELHGESRVETLAAAVDVCHRYKALADGLNLVRRENNWAYFDTMHRQLFNAPLPVRRSLVAT